MDKIESLGKAEAKILGDMQEIVSTIRGLSAHDVKDAQHGVLLLREIRLSVYENLNQIQHEYLILRGLRWLCDNGFESHIEWEWNPRQTGDADEPDLRGIRDGRILISAEATASENPIGTVDARMSQTLEKLNTMQGQRFYFVSTDRMAQRARTKANKRNWSIKVVQV